MEIIERDPEHGDARKMSFRLSEALLEAVGDKGDSSFDFKDVRQPRSVFVVGYDAGKPVACGALRPFSHGIAELKRMYAERGSGERVLKDLEERAIGMGYTRLRLSTRVANARALRFYQNHGYAQSRNYGKYMGRSNSVCLEKQLV